MIVSLHAIQQYAVRTGKRLDSLGLYEYLMDDFNTGKEISHQVAKEIFPITTGKKRKHTTRYFTWYNETIKSEVCAIVDGGVLKTVLTPICYAHTMGRGRKCQNDFQLIRERGLLQ